MSEEAVTHVVNRVDNKADSRLSTLNRWTVQKATANGPEDKFVRGTKTIPPQMGAVFNPRLIYWAGRRVRDYPRDGVFVLKAG